MNEEGIGKVERRGRKEKDGEGRKKWRKGAWS